MAQAADQLGLRPSDPPIYRAMMRAWAGRGLTLPGRRDPEWARLAAPIVRTGQFGSTTPFSAHPVQQSPGGQGTYGGGEPYRSGGPHLGREQQRGGEPYQGGEPYRGGEPQRAGAVRAALPAGAER
ncbi:hypothetical protein QIS99_10805 [Streptomyces sp. B-S-A8]|uniref:Uncharacterized protein n=1 Tax=Streptomyces solicavernae TaxID=3043614 RepID=A0ABT6RQH7_9ACTN|nr:hypothetical protein [Streptomyces sp. B-S-A8]MDI3386690.1 hypothetical protein [Streptomyces sp. B-S-A8]